MAHATVLFHRLALREYHAAEQWYAQRSPQAALRFQDAVDRAVERIAASPNLWRLFGRHHRWVRAGRFPYVLYYRILDADRVMIMAVAHARRRLGYGRKRT
jgi:plasmid stabilization system protein ParE